MKFRQRQILLILGLLCALTFLLLHSRTPDPDPARTDPLLDLNRREARAQLAAHTGVDRQHGGPASTDRDKEQGGHQVLKDHHKNQTSFKEPGIQAASPTQAPLSYVARSDTGGECMGLKRPVNVAEAQTFQMVDGTTSHYVFSAFLDLQQKLVRIISLKAQSAPKFGFCLLWYNGAGGAGGGGGGGGVGGGGELKVVPAAIMNLPEHHGRKYSAAYVQCPLPADVNTTYPYAVSVTSQDCRRQNNDVMRQPTNVLAVQRTEELERNFTVCVTALNFKYSRAYELVEMLELNRMLGAQRFTFYVQSVGDNVEKVLRHYQDLGVVQLVRWDLPVEADHWPPNKAKPSEVHYFAQLASHNDCLNRHRGGSRYLVYQDLDEFIIPKKTRTWSDMMAAINKDASVYLFRCVFFRKEWPKNEDQFEGRDVSDKYRSVVLTNVRREPTFFPHSQRAKYIVDPDRIQVVGIHNIWQYRGGQNPRMVPETDAALHHYRTWENPGDAHRAVKDTDMYRFREDLLQRLKQRWQELPQIPLDIPLEFYGPV